MSSKLMLFPPELRRWKHNPEGADKDSFMKVSLRFLFVIGLMATFFAGASSVLAADCDYAQQFTASTCLGTVNLSSLTLKTTELNTFVEPDAPENSLFGRRWYGRLADFADVRAAPSRTAPVARNVGDGYLFASLRTRVQNESGETWYEINPGEFVHGDDLQVAEVSDFQGVETTSQPQRPFGWVVQEVRPSRQPDGEPDAAFEKLERFDFVEIYDAIPGEDEWIWYDIGDGRWVKQTFFSIVDVSPRPAEVGDDEYWTEVDLYEQTFAAYEGDRLVYATLISSGLNRWPTNEGLFQVWSRLKEYKMSGAEGKVDYYFLEDIPYIMYFDDTAGIALHGTYWHDRFGYKHSHGCVNMPVKDAEWTYNWSAEAPNDLWVWVHTSNPEDHLAWAKDAAE